MNKHTVETDHILLELRNETSESEHAALQQEIENNPISKEAFEQTSRLYYALQNRRASQFDTKDALESVRNKTNQQRNRRRLIAWSRAVAATASVVAAFIIIQLFNSPKHDSSFVFPESSSNPVLILADGKQVNLTSNGDESPIEIRNIADTSSTPIEGVGATNTIYVPKGGDYHFKLSDGTVVWLNSDSRLRFPVEFDSHVRKIELEGEGYFEVSHAADWPFVVVTRQAQTRVLGTQFNINAYSDNSDTKITLVEGSVEVRTPQEKGELTPGTQAVITSTKPIEYRKIDPEQFITWKSGILNFESTTLNELIPSLERWYPVIFHLEKSSIGTRQFTGAIKRNIPLEFFLEFICKTSDLEYQIHDNIIEIKEKKKG